MQTGHAHTSAVALYLTPVTDQPCTSPLFGSKRCKTILSYVDLRFDLGNGSPEKINMQKYLDALGIGSAEYIRDLEVDGYYWNGLPPGPGIAPTF